MKSSLFRLCGGFIVLVGLYFAFRYILMGHEDHRIIADSLENNSSHIEITAPDGHILDPDERMEMEYSPSGQPFSAEWIDREALDGKGQYYSIVDPREPEEQWSGVWLMDTEEFSGGSARRILYDENTGQWRTEYSFDEGEQ